MRKRTCRVVFISICQKIKKIYEKELIFAQRSGERKHLEGKEGTASYRVNWAGLSPTPVFCVRFPSPSLRSGSAGRMPPKPPLPPALAKKRKRKGRLPKNRKKCRLELYFERPKIQFAPKTGWEPSHPSAGRTGRASQQQNFPTGGEGGIRTHEDLSILSALQADALDHYATSPLSLQFYPILPSEKSAPGRN